MLLLVLVEPAVLYGARVVDQIGQHETAEIRKASEDDLQIASALLDGQHFDESFADLEQFVELGFLLLKFAGAHILEHHRQSMMVVHRIDGQVKLFVIVE